MLSVASILATASAYLITPASGEVWNPFSTYTVRWSGFTSDTTFTLLLGFMSGTSFVSANPPYLSVSGISGTSYSVTPSTLSTFFSNSANATIMAGRTFRFRLTGQQSGTFRNSQAFFVRSKSARHIHLNLIQIDAVPPPRESSPATSMNSFWPSHSYRYFVRRALHGPRILCRTVHICALPEWLYIKLFPFPGKQHQHCDRICRPEQRLLHFSNIVLPAIAHDVPHARCSQWQLLLVHI